MLEKASNAKKILMLFMSENAKNYAGLFYRWLLASLPDFSFPFNQGGESQRAGQGVVKYFTTPWC